MFGPLKTENEQRTLSYETASFVFIIGKWNIACHGLAEKQIVFVSGECLVL